MNWIKYLLVFCITFYLSSNIWGVQVIENTQIKETTSSGLSNVVSGGIATGVMFGLIIGIIIIIIWLILRYIKLNMRKNNDLLYSKYLLELDKCNYNKDSRLKWRSWKSFFLTFKRSEILLNTKDGFKMYGFYDGEMIQKDKFFLIATYRIISLFKRDKDILIIPYELRHKVRKELINGKYVLIIDCESIDEALNTDYYSQCVFSHPKDDNSLISFNDYIQKTYMEKFVLRQAIKDNLLNYKESMDKVTEINPNIQVERKNPKQ